MTALAPLLQAFFTAKGPNTTHGQENGGHRYSRSVYGDARGRVVAEQWIVHGG